MFLWRISNHADLLGTGGLWASGRWHTSGRPVVYLAETAASALLEVLVLLELDEESMPSSYQLLKVEAADDLPREEIARFAPFLIGKMTRASRRRLGTHG